MGNFILVVDMCTLWVIRLASRTDDFKLYRKRESYALWTEEN